MEADRPPRILFVDEDAHTRDWATLFLRIWGFEPLAVGCGPEARQAAMLHSPDVVVPPSQEAGIQVHRVKPTD
jgi:hypothetical protein